MTEDDKDMTKEELAQEMTNDFSQNPAWVDWDISLEGSVITFRSKEIRERVHRFVRNLGQ